MTERHISAERNITERNLRIEIERARAYRDSAGSLAVLVQSLALVVVNSESSLAELARGVIYQGHYDWKNIAVATAGTAMFSILGAMAVSDHFKVKRLKRQKAEVDSRDMVF